MRETVEHGNFSNKISTLSVIECVPRGEEISDRLLALNAFLAFCQQYGRETKALMVARALATETLERIASGRQSVVFNSANIAELIQQRVPAEGATAWLSKVWKDLEHRLEERRSGFQDTARQAGATVYAWPKKLPGAGGAGNSSTYSIEFLPIPTVEEPPTAPLAADISYVRELTLEPAFWVKPLLRTGFVLTGWRRASFIGFGATVIVSVGTALVWTWVGIARSWSSPQIGGVVLLLLFGAMAAWLGISILRPISNLIDRRIIVSPDALVSFRELNVQLELSRERSAPEEPHRVIRLVRYSGRCPVCGETVHLSDGRREFPERLVGRCEEHPSEHVYSFDRYTKTGRFLR